MGKRPRKAPPIQKRTKTDAQDEEFRNCSVPGCSNIISTVDWAANRSGPIFCIIHRSLYTKKA